jgi:hypothetical protein
VSRLQRWYLWLRRGEAGTAILEFHYLGILLLVPLVYIMLSVLAVQQGSYGVTQAAREAGRVYARTGDEDLARLAAQVALDDQDVSEPMHLDIRGTYSAGAEITVVVTTEVGLPGLPDFLSEGANAAIPVEAVHVVVVDTYRSTS